LIKSRGKHTKKEQKFLFRPLEFYFFANIRCATHSERESGEGECHSFPLSNFARVVASL